MVGVILSFSCPAQAAHLVPEEGNDADGLLLLLAQSAQQLLARLRKRQRGLLYGGDDGQTAMASPAVRAGPPGSSRA
jgi:hypothetical protein